MYRLDDRLFFANARYVKGRVREALHAAPPDTHSLVLDAEAVTHIDATGAAALEELTKSLRRQGVGLAIARLKHWPKRHFDDTGLTDVLGEERFYPTVRAAVAACANASGARR
jgi:SulP family sulfate permease